MKKDLKTDLMREKIETYFASRRRVMTDEKGAVVRNRAGETQFEEKPPTVTGLALALGLSSREALFEIKEPAKKALVSQALLRIEEAAEEKLFYKDSFAGTKLFLETNFPRWQGGGEEPTDLGPFAEWAR